MEHILRKCEIDSDGLLRVLEASGLIVTRSKIEAKFAKSEIVTDSRLLKSGDIFIAIKGGQVDSHDHIQSLARSNPNLVILETSPKPNDAWSQTIPWVQVTDTRSAWSYLAAAAVGNPQNQLKLLAVTGTNGKTSTVWMIGEILRAAGIKTMTIGTLGAFIGGGHIPTQHTTPDPNVLFGLLKLAADQNVNVVAMEVSSHALAQGKVAPLQFDGAAFTSFSRDHLDFHRSIDEYWNTKWSLFTNYMRPDALAAFASSLYPRLSLHQLVKNSMIYGLNLPRELRHVDSVNSLNIEIDETSFAESSLKFIFNGSISKFVVPYFAPHAIENLAAAAALSSVIIGQFPTNRLFHQMRPVPGRLEPVAVLDKPKVIVDYAHTPDALEKTLLVLKPLCAGNLSVVFGCGGNRDRGKRPLMGAVAARLADRIIVTSDNPRKEDPDKIIAEICDGIKFKSKLRIESDRAKAINYAISSAGPADLVLIAGKGHETTQIFADSTIDFDDRLIAAEILNKLRT